MRFVLILGVALGGFVLEAQPQKSCQYSVESYSLEWTAFKTTEKVPVKGTFKKIDVTSHSSAVKSPNEFLKGLRFKVDTLSLDTQNPARDQNIVTNFFKVISGKPEFSGQVRSIDLGGSAAELDLTVAGKTHRLPMKIEGSVERGFEARGTIDLLKLGLKAAFDSIHTSCVDLHKGADGVSKTWSDVEILVKLKLRCVET